jgi:predicted  nucleic acid-binding Zn-ribbon protein
MAEENGYWKKRYKSLAKGVAELEKTIESQTSLLSTMNSNLENAQEAVDLNKMILRNAVAEHNKKEQEYVGLITRMKAKLKELGFSDLNSLGS